MFVLPRYLLRLFWPAFLVSLTVFVVVLCMNNFLRLFTMAMLKGISFLWILSCFMRLLPFVLSLALPMAYLVSLLLTLGGLSESGEIMALRASGYSFLGIAKPFLALGFLFSFLLLYLNHKASPEGLRAFKNQYVGASQLVERVNVEPDSFVELGDWKLLAHKSDNRSGLLQGVYLTKKEESSGQNLQIYAPDGQISLEKGRAIHLTLKNGRFDLPQKDPGKVSIGRFEEYRILIPLTGPENQAPPDIQEINSKTLKKLIADPTIEIASRADYETQLALRTSAALSPLVFFLIALPLGIQLGRHSKGKGFALSLVVLFIFYGLVTLGIGIGRRHPHYSSLAPWMSDTTIALVGIFLTTRLIAQ